MKKISLLLGSLVGLFMSVNEASAGTQRIPQFSNDKVAVWQTIIYPNKDQLLKMHRHDYDRVLVAFNDGVLKVTNDKGESHILKLEKDHAYFLARDISGEEHSDENMSGHPIKTMVIELR